MLSTNKYERLISRNYNKNKVKLRIQYLSLPGGSTSTLAFPLCLKHGMDYSGEFFREYGTSVLYIISHYHMEKTEAGLKGLYTGSLYLRNNTEDTQVRIVQLQTTVTALVLLCGVLHCDRSQS